MSQSHETPDLFAAAGQPPNEPPASPEPREPAASGTAPDAATDAASLGARLRTARESKGLTLAECGRRLHLPVKVLERLEADDHGSPEHWVFLRGALHGYATLLGLPPGACDDVLRATAPVEQPALVSVARTSHTRWLLQRYGTAATYIVLTATIAVPLVVLGLRGGLQRPAARIVSLDQPAISAPRAEAPASVNPHVQVQVPTPNPQDLAPFRASMTPFSAIGIGDPATDQAAPPPPPQDGQHTLTVSATADCWVEVTDADGNKLASAMLHAGDSRSWHSDGVLHVVLGNADGVSVTRDGEPLALDAYRRANVARFDVFADPGDGGSENH